MTWVGMVFIAFLCGSLPFSVWLGKWFVGVDVRQYGDGNPGSANVFRAGNKVVGLVALLLDVAKGAAPVGLSYYTLGIRGIPMYLIAIAPILGHVFSPFLKVPRRKGNCCFPRCVDWIDPLEGVSGGCHFYRNWYRSDDPPRLVRHARHGSNTRNTADMDARSSPAGGVGESNAHPGVDTPIRLKEKASNETLVGKTLSPDQEVSVDG